MDYWYLLIFQWFKDIFTGLIVTGIVSIIGYSLIDRKNTKEHEFKVISANEAVLSAMRQLLPEQISIIDEELIMANIRAAALHYELEEHEILTVKNITDIMMSEITNSPYLTANDKYSMINRIKAIDVAPEILHATPSLFETKREIAHRNQMLWMIPMVLVLTVVEIWSPRSISFTKILTSLLVLSGFLFCFVRYYALFLRYTRGYLYAYKNQGSQQATEQTSE